MTTPQLSQPILFTPTELRSNPTLAASVTRLGNEAFLRSKENDPAKWSNTTFRFSNVDEFHAMFSEDSVMALIFDRSVPDNVDRKFAPAMNGDEHEKLMDGKVVACAAVVPWNVGWNKDRAGSEEGWEIKAVCVDGDARYLRRGLAVQLLTFLENYLITQLRLQFQELGVRESEKPRQGTLTLWILATECINGAYWRKKGYQEVRRRTEGAGVWSCKTSFEITTLRKDVCFDIDV